MFMKYMRQPDYGSLFSIFLGMKGAGDMHHLPAFLRLLRALPSLPLYLRLSIFLLSFIICGAFMILALKVTNNRGLTPIFAIPVALAAWMLQPLQAALSLLAAFLILIILYTTSLTSPLC